MTDSPPKFAWIAQMLTALYRGEITRFQTIGCTRCDFTGRPVDYPVHALTCPGYESRDTQR